MADLFARDNITLIVATLEAVAAYFKITPRTARRWREAGMPGRPGAFDLAEITSWRRSGKGRSKAAAQAQAEDRQAPDEAGGETKAHWAKEELKARAELKKQQLAEKRKETVPRVDVEKHFMARNVAFFQGCRYLARALPPLLANRPEREIASIMDERIVNLIGDYGRFAAHVQAPGPYDRDEIHAFVDRLVDVWEAEASNG